MSKNIEKKRNREKKVITEMIRLYCKKNHKNGELCDECKEVLEYSLKVFEQYNEESMGELEDFAEDLTELLQAWSTHRSY